MGRRKSLEKGIKVDKLNAAIQANLTEYNQVVIDGVKSLTHSAMRDLVKQTRETAPVGKRDKHYRDNIASRKLRETDACLIEQWYVKAPYYRVSHLLEYGHALRDGGRSRAFHFIGNATDVILSKYIEYVEEVIRNG